MFAALRAEQIEFFLLCSWQVSGDVGFLTEPKEMVGGRQSDTALHLQLYTNK